MVLTAKEALVITPSVAFARESTRFACISSANNASMKSWVYLNSAFLLRAAIGFSRRVTSAGGRLLFFQSVFNLSLHIMHLFPSDRPPSILFAKKFRIHDSFIATPPQKMRGTLRLLPMWRSQRRHFTTSTGHWASWMIRSARLPTIRSYIAEWPVAP